MESKQNTPPTDDVKNAPAAPDVPVAPPVATPEVVAPVAPAVPDVQSAEKSKQAAAIGMFKEGMGFLRGIGGPQDFAMASARLLDSADLEHPPAFFYCALMYFAGVGVSRNTQTASDYAGRYLEVAPNGQFAQVAKDVIDGTFGTENARKMLVERPAASTKAAAPVAVAQVKSNKPMYIAAAVLIPVLLGGGLFAFTKMHDVSSLGPTDISNIKIESLLSKDDVASAQKEAMTAAATMQSDAQSQMQKQDADKAAQAKAEQEQKDAADAQAQAQAKAEQEARSTQAAQAAQVRNSEQTTKMLATALQAARAGEFDRANGILDAVLAGDASNQQAISLKESVGRARARAINNMQIK